MNHPLLYEINTRCWLWELSQKHGAAITLADVPASEFSDWRRRGFTHLWLMGGWSTGPRTRDFSLKSGPLRKSAARLLPDFSEADIVGSPYAIAGYHVSETLGGEAGLKKFRERLGDAGLGLILDFIPNHTGLDHPWLRERPELFVQSKGPRAEVFRENTRRGPVWLAHGKDPYFPAWGDTAQLDYRNPATHTAMIDELKSLASRCDGVRCDMAMLVLNDVFARTWSEFSIGSQDRSAAEFWAEAISNIKGIAPDFLFLAEAYWDLETRLLNLGFDYAYDKRLTDHILARRPGDVQTHLLTGRSKEGQITHHAHFLENHDEPRIASVLSLAEHRAAALLVLGLPGMRLLHQGQLTGATLRASVHLRRFPAEAPQPEIAEFYDFYLGTLLESAVGHGTGELLIPTEAWEGNPTARNFVIIQWQNTPSEFEVIVVNLAAHHSQCYVKLTIGRLEENNWQMIDRLGSERLQRRGADLARRGLYLDLPPHGAQLFHCSAVPA